LSNGYAAEALFDYLATDKGLTVSRPLAHARYDRIVDHNGKLSRVQIKMTANKRGNAYWVKTSGYNQSKYTFDVDFMVIYIKPECAWFIIPIEDVTGAALQITMGGKMTKYINNWKLLYAQEN
jgi:hypothetical protein